VQPWSADFTHSFLPLTGPGFEVDASLFEASGTAPPFTPIPIDLEFFYEFDNTCGGVGTPQKTALFAASGGSTVHIFTQGDNVSIQCSDLLEPLNSGSATSTHAVQLEMIFEPAGAVAIFSSPLIFSFTTWMEYEYTPQQQNLTPDADFENQDLSLWQIGGSGNALVAEYPEGSGNHVVVLITGSPVSLSRLLDTPSQPFDLSFDYTFPGLAGSLDILLGDTLLTSLSAAGEIPGSFRQSRVRVEDPALLGRAGETLAFVLDGTPATEVFLDNVAVFAVPEPSAEILNLAALSTLGLLTRSRRVGCTPL
jgi:hypothetical protein